MAEKNEQVPGAFSLLGTASTMGLHMVSGPIVGGGLGWLADHWLGSWPVGAAIGLVLGLAAGFRNVWADARYLAQANAARDAERKKKEEEAENRPKSAGKEENSALTRTIVPVVHKDGQPFANTRSSGRRSEAAAAEDQGPEERTASLLAGTATCREQNLEELDETMEAIRRVLAGEKDEKALAGDREKDGREGV